MSDLVVILLLFLLNIQLWEVTHFLKKNATQGFTMAQKLEAIEKDVKKRGYVTPPFEAANPKRSVRSSSRNVIQRKSPDQIRNENFEKIKEGQIYGRY